MKIEYFCEACRASVKSNSEVCPKCNSFFSGVRCPVCRMEGDIKSFLNGCPSCGFLADTIPLAMVDGSFRHKASGKPHCSASRYWKLSAIVAITALFILLLWLNY